MRAAQTKPEAAERFDMCHSSEKCLRGDGPAPCRGILGVREGRKAI
jgi:hypothetical protein